MPTCARPTRSVFVSVLELCLRTRLKHLFYVSTMGVFPAYFCNFAREYRRSRIDDQMSPDVNDMKNVFPLGAVGYPWSKLVAEQGVLFREGCRRAERDIPPAADRITQLRFYTGKRLSVPFVRSSHST